MRYTALLDTRMLQNITEHYAIVFSSVFFGISVCKSRREESKTSEQLLSGSRILTGDEITRYTMGRNFSHRQRENLFKKGLGFLVHSGERRKKSGSRRGRCWERSRCANRGAIRSSEFLWVFVKSVVPGPLTWMRWQLLSHVYWCTHASTLFHLRHNARRL